MDKHEANYPQLYTGWDSHGIQGKKKKGQKENTFLLRREKELQPFMVK